MRAMLALLLLSLAGQAWAEACVVHAEGKQVEVKLCQQNRSIPANLFRTGFCAPQLQGQKVEVSFAEQCPTGAFGECRNAKVQARPTSRTSTTTASRPTPATSSPPANSSTRACG